MFVSKGFIEKVFVLPEKLFENLSLVAAGIYDFGE